MKDIIQTAEELAGMLVNSEIYKSYREAKEELKNRPDLRAKIEEYKSLNMRYQLGMIEGNAGNSSFEDEKRLSSMYQQLIADEKSIKFLESEKKLLILIERVYDIIGRACKVELFDC